MDVNLEATLRDGTFGLLSLGQPEAEAESVLGRPTAVMTSVKSIKIKISRYGAVQLSYINHKVAQIALNVSVLANDRTFPAITFQGWVPSSNLAFDAFLHILDHKGIAHRVDARRSLFPEDPVLEVGRGG